MTVAGRRYGKKNQGGGGGTVGAKKGGARKGMGNLGDFLGDKPKRL